MVVPTTRSVEVLAWPRAPGAVTRTSDPMWAPTWRSVVAPSAISSSAPGSRPLAGVSSSRPRRLWPAIAETVVPLMLTSSWPTPRLTSEMARSPARPVVSWLNEGAWSLAENTRSNGCP